MINAAVDLKSGFRSWFLEQSSLLGLAAVNGLLWGVFAGLAPGFIKTKTAIHELIAEITRSGVSIFF